MKIITARSMLFLCICRDAYHAEKTSENDRPDEKLFQQPQKFVVLELSNGGKVTSNLVSDISNQLIFMSLLLFWTFLVRFSGPPTPSCQKEQENHKIGPQMSRIGTRKVKETQKIVF